MSPNKLKDGAAPRATGTRVGVMLYESADRAAPVSAGQRVEVLADKSRRIRRDVAELVPELPPDLVTDCVGDLMAREPGGSPGGRGNPRRTGGVRAHDVRSRGPRTAGARRPSSGARRSSPSSEPPSAPWVSVRQSPSTCMASPDRQECASIGHFADAVEREAAALVLRGRCYERESVPYKAVDGVIDSLSRYLKTLAGPQVKALLPEGVSALVRLFRGPAQDRGPWDERPHCLRREPADPLALRQRGFGCLRQLLVRLSAQQPVLVFIRRPAVGGPRQHGVLEDALRAPDPPACCCCILPHRRSRLAALPARPPARATADTPACRACRLGPLTSPTRCALTDDAGVRLGHLTADPSDDTLTCVRSSAS